jgi:hypothetical protein
MARSSGICIREGHTQRTSSALGMASSLASAAWHSCFLSSPVQVCCAGDADAVRYQSGGNTVLASDYLDRVSAIQILKE